MMFKRIRKLIDGIKQYIDEMEAARNKEMEEWKRDDPEAYYDYIFAQHR